MAAPDKIYPFRFQPGIQRDGTKFFTNAFIDAQWCRWYRGMPKKMGGYVQIDGTIDAIPTGLFVLPTSPNFNVYIGNNAHLKYLPINSAGQPLTALVDRTPAGFAANPYNCWSFDVMFSSVANSSILIAHAPPNLSSIDSMVETQVWYGDALAASPLVPTGNSVSGGVVALHPYLFIFGNSGTVSWTAPNDPTTLVNSAKVTGDKIVAGLSTRGGNSSPAGLFWSLGSLIRSTANTNSPNGFTFDTISSEISILSSRSIVEYDGKYFWAAADRFLYYNGIVQELPNSMSLNYFFSNINMAQRQKVWATKITKWGEIWWFFPTGQNVECNHAVIYNLRENAWYDTEIDRSIGYFAQTFDYPIWAENVPNNSPINSTYSIWMQENGVNKQTGNVVSLVPSYFESGPLSLLTSGATGQEPGVDRWTYLYRIEPDLNQTGTMTVVINGREYARAPVVSSSELWPSFNLLWPQYTNITWVEWGDYTFGADVVKIDIREQRREMNLKFISQTIDGNYEMGNTLLVARIGDGRQ